MKSRGINWRGVRKSTAVVSVLALALASMSVVPGLAKGVGVFGPEDAAKAHGPIAWTESLPQAQKTAAKEKKVIFIDFWATWCGPCKQMLSTTYQDKDVVARSKQFVPVLVDADKQQSLLQKYKVEAIPTVIFMDAKGKVLVRSTGFADRASFLKLMDEATKKAK